MDSFIGKSYNKGIVMKFFLISNMYPTAECPGYGSFVKNVCDGLSSYGISLSDMAVIRGKGEGHIDKIFKYIRFYVSIIAGFFKKYDFIYVHFPNQAIPLLNFLYKFRKPKIIVNYHGEDLLYEEKGYTKTLGIQMEKFCHKYASAIIVPSQYFKDIVLERNILPSSKVVVSPSGGINPDIFFPLDCKNYNSILHIGYVGRLEIDKGIKDFLLTCDRLNQENLNFIATIIGYGSYYDEMVSFIEKNNLKSKITIINGIPQIMLGNYYRSMDLLIFSSSRESESLGLTGIEAMACGVPVIGSNVGGIASYVENGKNGWLVSVHNVEEIVDSIHKYMNMENNEKEQMRRYCIETGKKYYREQVCYQLSKDIREQLISSPIILFNDNHLGALLHFRGEVISALVQEGFRVVVVAPNSDRGAFSLPQGVEYRPIVMNRTSKGLWDGVNYFCQLCRIFRDVKPNLVINYTIKPILFGVLAAKLMHRPSVSFFAGISSIISNLAKSDSVKSKVAMYFLGKILRYNKKAIFLNEEDVSFVTSNHLYPIEKVLLLHGGEGVNTDKYAPLMIEKLSSRFKVVMISRVLRTKGYDEFIGAARLFKQSGLDIDFYLCGGLDEMHPGRITKEEIANVENEHIITYMGHLDDLQHFIGDADCVVLPSYYNEGMNRSLMEALSMGIPIITTNNRGCRELVLDGKTGFIIPPQNTKALYDAILRMYNLPLEVRESFRKESRKYAIERFDIKNVVDAYLLLAKQVLD